IIDRLTLTPERVRAIASDVRDVVALPDPVGEVVRGSTLPNGIDLRQVRVPLGVVGIIYEARPNVTVDAAALCLKSGNAVLLRGSGSAYESNTALVRVLRDAVGGAGLPADAIQLVPGESRESVRELMRARAEAGVTVHADQRVLADAKDTKATVVEATPEDWDTEYLSYDIAAAVVDSLDKAVEHILLWTSGHTEAIVTTSQQAARRFTQLV